MCLQDFPKEEFLQSFTAEQTGQTVEQIIADGDRDRWFTADEAKDYGFVDRVLTRDDTPNANADS